MRIVQMLSAAPGMYQVDTKHKTTTLVVMWVLAEDTQGVQQIVGLTTDDLGDDLVSAVKRHWDDGPQYSTQKIDGYQTIR